MTATNPPRTVNMGGIDAVATPDGRVKLTLWTDDRDPQADPDTFVITPAQALDLLAKLPLALRAALKGLFQ